MFTSCRYLHVIIKVNPFVVTGCITCIFKYFPWCKYRLRRELHMHADASRAGGAAGGWRDINLDVRSL